MAESDRLLPLIPLSILTKNSLVAVQSLEKAKNALAVAKASAKSISTETLRHLYENERIEKARLEALNDQIQSVQSVTAFKWDADIIAKQIAIINSQLYSHITLDNNLAFSDPRGTHLLYFTDFHRYLTSSFTHQLIYWSEIYRSSDGKVVDPPVQHRDSLISHVVKVAYLLLHVYRDFSGCFAIMKALSSSEVRRIRRLWTQCPSRSKDLYKELIVLLSPTNNYQSYQDMLVKKLSMISSDLRSKQGMMVAVPWFFPHLNQIRHIAQEYTAGGQDNKSDDKRQRLLSAPGAQKLNEVMAILRKCQSNSSSDWEDFEPKSTVKSVTLQGLRKSIDPPMDLLKLAPGNLGVYHWLVSRVYLTKQQLIDESMGVEPLTPGEELICENIEVNEETYDVISGLEVPSEDVTPLISGSEPLQQETNGPLDPLSRRSSTSYPDDSQADRPDVNDYGQSNMDETLLLEATVTHEGAGLNIEWSQEMEEHEPVQADNVDTEIVEDDIGSPSPDFSDPLRVDSPASPLEAVSSPQPEVSMQDTDEDNAPGQQNDGFDQPASNVGEVLSRSTQSRRDARKSRLSPSAPAFVPKLMSMSPIPEPVTSNQSASPASSTTFEEDLTSIPKNGSPGQAASSSDDQSSANDDDEVWRGYQPSSTKVKDNDQANDSESDKWNGYPTPKSEDADDEEEEEWTGYPGPSNQAVQDLRRQSSRSSTSEDWKGYQAHKTEDIWKLESRQQASEHDWQGYTLETLDEDELDSSTMMNGEFAEKRRERESVTNYDPLDSFKNQIHTPETSSNKPKYHKGGTIGRAASKRIQNNQPFQTSSKGIQ
jgi:RasGEF domain